MNFDLLKHNKVVLEVLLLFSLNCSGVCSPFIVVKFRFEQRSSDEVQFVIGLNSK